MSRKTGTYKSKKNNAQPRAVASSFWAEAICGQVCHLSSILVEPCVDQKDSFFIKCV